MRARLLSNSKKINKNVRDAGENWRHVGVCDSVTNHYTLIPPPINNTTNGNNTINPASPHSQLTYPNNTKIYTLSTVLRHSE